ncbi:uncharacterized protein PgNI_09117 [Pyricularia grisea]|uniref:Uncharacterized protein n=1 Tax=Pyricularia grisea TaxID=148305 RepID=A0A6P8ARI8_PYRGI|nr:uncharacterized protein PgNI_09117 [Pyricularia grisea]TLD04720.1 hypothetical protein PgNI_09117 [Pyricularia grisea]
MILNVFILALLAQCDLASAFSLPPFLEKLFSRDHDTGPIVSRRFSEYQLPVAAETHEFARVPDTDFLVLSQMSNSRLVKIQLDSVTEEPIGHHSFPMGSNDRAGLHGIWPSDEEPGMIWISLQSENRLQLIDPGRGSLDEAPTVIRTIDVPEPGNGPHSIFEINGRVWAGLKVASEQTGEYFVFSVNVDGTDPILYPCLNSPVFIKEDPSTGLIYVTQDAESSIMRLNITSGETEQLPIPTSVGNTPVGMTTITSGPLSGVWFSLAGNSTGGTGTFGRVVPSTGELEFFQLTRPAALGFNAGLLHIADATTEAAGPGLWLLSTTLLSSSSGDALIRVGLNDAVTAITGEEYIALPTQDAWAHRVVVLNSTVMVSELRTYTLAQLVYENEAPGMWAPTAAR